MKGQLWLLTGFIDQNLSLNKLQQVLKTYTKIGVVPVDYNQALLWQSETVPDYYKLQPKY